MKRNNQSDIYLIDKLDAISCLLDILPYFIKNGWGGIKKGVVYYVDGTQTGIMLASLTLGVIAQAQVKKFEFYMRDVKDSIGDSIWLKVMFADALEFQRMVLNNPEFKNAVKAHDKGGGLSLFLLKELMCNHLLDPDVALKHLYLIRVFSWWARIKQRLPGNMILMMERKPWCSELKEFASREDVEIKFLARRGLNLRKMIERLQNLKNLIKATIYGWMLVKYNLKGGKRTNDTVEHLKTNAPKMAVEYYGKLNLDSPELFSDLFFYQMSDFPAQSILLYFGLSRNSATDTQLKEIRKHGMLAVATNSRAAVTPNIAVFHPSWRKITVDLPNKILAKDIAFNREWLREKIFSYLTRYHYYVDFFMQYNIKIHVSWYKQGFEHCAISDAMKSVGGINAIYQRSFESLPEPWTTVKADVVFGFSKLGSHLGKDIFSKVPYYVVTGYLGDHRFSLSRQKAREVRHSLNERGAKRVIAYIDENPAKDSRWGMGIEIPNRDHAHLFRMVLADPCLGLVLKPKDPSFFRERLGPMADLLREAEKTGRCYVFEEGILGSNYPPAVAALCSDIVIHGYCSATTAAVEAALAGVPSIMLDYEGWSQSPIYRLKEGKVIFRCLDDALKTCQDHWKSPHGITGFGDWSEMIDECDPFRDGRAAERMGNYLKWLQEGYNAKRTKTEILANAAERYADLWGKDKIITINCEYANREITV